MSSPTNPSRRTVLAAAGAAVGTTALGGVAYAATQDSSADQNESTGTSQDPAVQWTETYSSGSSDQAVTVVPSSDGGYTFLGHAQDEDESTSGVWLVGVDESGAKQWEARPGDGSWGSPTDLVESDDGGYVVTARTGRNDAGLIRTDSQGRVEWTIVYQGPDDEPETTRTVAGGGGPEEDSKEVLTAVESHPGGGFVAVGRTVLGGSEGVVLFVDEDGSQTSEWRRSEAAFTDLTTVREPEEFVVAGRDEDHSFAKRWTATETEWDDIRPRQWDSFDNVVRRADGGYAFDVEIEDGYGLFTLDSDGDVAFERAYDEADDTPEEVVGGLVQTASRGFVLAGNGQADRSVWLVGTGPEGERRGSVTLDEGPGTACPIDPNPLAPTADGGVIVAYTANLGGTASDEQSDVRLAKVGPSLTAAPETPTAADPDEPTETTTEFDEDTGTGDADDPGDAPEDETSTPTETTPASDDDTDRDEDECEP